MQLVAVSQKEVFCKWAVRYTNWYLQMKTLALRGILDVHYPPQQFPTQSIISCLVLKRRTEEMSFFLSAFLASLELPSR